MVFVMYCSGHMTYCNDHMIVMWLTDLVHPGCYWSSPSQLLQPKLVNTDDCMKRREREEGTKRNREEGEGERWDKGRRIRGRRYEGRKGVREWRQKRRERWGVEGGGTDTVVHCIKWPVHCSKLQPVHWFYYMRMVQWQTAHPRWLIRDSALGTTPTLECWLWPNPRAYRNTMRKEMEELTQINWECNLVWTFQH